MYENLSYVAQSKLENRAEQQNSVNMMRDIEAEWGKKLKKGRQRNCQKSSQNKMFTIICMF